MGQLTGLVVINLLFGFLVPGIDNLAHIGGLVTGLASACCSRRRACRRCDRCGCDPGPTPGTTVPAFGAAGNRAIRAAGLGLMAVAFFVLWTMGAAAWG